MTAIPFAPVTSAALARLTREEQLAFGVAADHIGADQKPPMDVIVTLLLAVQRLITDRDVPPPGAPHTLRDVLRAHYLAQITCDHEQGADQPVCACSVVNLGWHGSVGLAVEAWLDHVLAMAGDPAGLLAHVAPARFVLTVLHRQDPSIPAVTAGPDPTTGVTVCGLQMLASELWRPVDRRPDDRLCSGCENPGSEDTDVQEALL